jgi:hypothetical protein
MSYRHNRASCRHNGSVRRRVLWLIVALAGSAMSVSAHHSIAGVYDRSKPMTFDAVVAEFHLVNPHPFLVVTVDSPGQSERWKLELDNRYELVEVGVTATTFTPGERISVRGIPARDGSHQLYAMRIDRAADGFRYEQVGASPRIQRGR